MLQAKSNPYCQTPCLWLSVVFVHSTACGAYNSYAQCSCHVAYRLVIINYYWIYH